MNSTLKPVLPTSSQNTSSPAPNKPMHPQGAPMSYGQPSGPISQNPFPNTNMAHNHPTTQQNHYSLNVPGSGSHFSMGAIPASNHPVAISQPGGPNYNPPKNASYSTGFQHTQNQNTLPPVSQTIPATTSPSSGVPQNAPVSQHLSNSNSSATPAKELPVEDENPQPNGTTEVEQPETDEPEDAEETEEPEVQDTHEIHPDPDVPPVTVSQPEEHKPAPQTSPEQVSTSSEEAKPTEEVKSTPEPAPAVKEPTPQVPVVKEPTPQPPPPTTSPSQVTDEATPAPTKPESSTVPATEVVLTPPTIVSEPVTATSNNPPEPEPVQTEAESTKDTQESDPLAIDSVTEEKPAVTQAKSVISIEKEEVKDESEGGKSDVEEEESSEEASESEKDQKDEDYEVKTPARKLKVVKKTEPKTPVQKSPGTGKINRQRKRTQHYQSPLPEIEIITKITATPTRSRNNDDKLIYFYKNEFLAVRNAEGGFYLCQAVQNIYKSSSKIKIRWLSQDKNDKSGEIYTPDFYDLTDFDCILTSLDLTRVGKGRYKLKPAEKLRTDSILKRCLAVEKGEISQPSVSAEHPDGLDLSLYKDEEQLKKKKKGIKRKDRPRSESPKKAAPTKKSPEAPKVRKVETKPTLTRSSSPAKKPVVVKKPPVPEPKKATPVSKAARGKRKAEIKTSPIMDQKKAKVLAKIGRKAGIPASTASSSSSKSQPSKSAKVSKPTPSTSKVTKPPPTTSKPPPRKAKRAVRKY